MRIQAYLDNNATTRLAPEALAAMTPYLTELYLNPSSSAGELLGASRPIADAKQQLAKLLGVPDQAENFILTSGASEANSWAVHIATARRPPGQLVSTAIEHPSLLAALEAARERAWSVRLAQPDSDGLVGPEAIAEMLTPDTALVSVMLANNETGVLQPVAEIGRKVRAICPNAVFHVDATQALGRVRVSLGDELEAADLVSLSAHKFHGPKGIGALVVAEGLTTAPLIHGRQEGGRRGGTPDAAAAAGLAAAADLAGRRLAEMAGVKALRDRFEADLAGRFPRTQILGKRSDRLPNTSAFIVPGLDAEDVVERLAVEGIVIAAGSACTSGSSAPSHVLLAMGLPYEQARAALRVSLSRETTPADLDLVLTHLSHLTRLAA